MPVDYDRWYKNQIDLGNLPDENGYYHYIPNESESIEEDWFSIENDHTVIRGVYGKKAYKKARFKKALARFEAWCYRQ